MDQVVTSKLGSPCSWLIVACCLWFLLPALQATYLLSLQVYQTPITEAEITSTTFLGSIFFKIKYCKEHRAFILVTILAIHFRKPETQHPSDFGFSSQVTTTRSSIQKALLQSSFLQVSVWFQHTPLLLWKLQHKKSQNPFVQHPTLAMSVPASQWKCGCVVLVILGAAGGI